MITKLITNWRSLNRIKQNQTTRSARFSQTNQYLAVQNKPNRYARQPILSQARLPIPPQGPRADYSGRPERVNRWPRCKPIGPCRCNTSARPAGHEKSIDEHGIDLPEAGRARLISAVRPRRFPILVSASRRSQRPVRRCSSHRLRLQSPAQRRFWARTSFNT